MTHGMGQAGFGQGKAPQVHRDTPRIWGGYDHELNELINESCLATFQSSLGCWLLLSGEILELFHFLKEPFPSTLESHPSLGESKAVPFPTVTLEREFQEFTKGLGETPTLLGLDTRCQIFLPFVEPSDVASPPAFFFFLEATSCSQVRGWGGASSTPNFYGITLCQESRQTLHCPGLQTPPAGKRGQRRNLQTK